jgi:hypothetical protein
MDFPVVTLGVTGALFNACNATGDTFDNSQPGTTLIFRNKNANDRIVRILSPNQCCFNVTGAIHDRLVTVPTDISGDSYVRISVDANRHNVGGTVSMVYDTAVAGLSCCAISM